MDNKDTTTHFGFNKVATHEKANLVARVFDSVAKNYDIMNDVMSLGMHRLWKHFASFSSNLKPGDKVLDIAGGTGDMTLKFKKLVGDTGIVWHTDINQTMLKTGRDKLLNHGVLTPQCLCDSEQLPFPANYFNLVCVAFGLRNMTNKAQALKEMYRVLAPGGMVLILEFSKIAKPLTPVYDLYSFKLLPLLGKIIAKDADSYTYLAESIRMHPDQESLKNLMLECGFDNVSYNNLTFGICAMHKGYKF